MNHTVLFPVQRDFRLNVSVTTSLKRATSKIWM